MTSLTRKLRYIDIFVKDVLLIDVDIHFKYICTNKSRVRGTISRCDHCGCTFSGSVYGYVWCKPQHRTFHYDKKCNKEIIVDWLPTILQAFMALRGELIDDIVGIIFMRIVWYDQ